MIELETFRHLVLDPNAAISLVVGESNTQVHKGDAVFFDERPPVLLPMSFCVINTEPEGDSGPLFVTATTLGIPTGSNSIVTIERNVQVYPSQSLPIPVRAMINKHIIRGK